MQENYFKEIPEPSLENSNEARIVTSCGACSKRIYEGEEYFQIYEESYCEDCADSYFRKIAELPNW